MDKHDWLPFLQKWSREMATSPNHAEKLPPEVVASGWLGFPGATDEQLHQRETRLWLQLPPSYRSFLTATNGWRTTGTFIDRLWSTEEVEWFKARNQDWIDAYTMYGDTEVSDEEYFVYGDEQDS